jgi:hypothetical protein
MDMTSQLSVIKYIITPSSLGLQTEVPTAAGRSGQWAEAEDRFLEPLLGHPGDARQNPGGKRCFEADI